MRHVLGLFLLILITITSHANVSLKYGAALCQDPTYFCIKVKARDRWQTLLINHDARDIVQRINRINTPLHAGMILAIPKQLDKITLYDVSPFPRHLNDNHEKTIYVNQIAQAWAAYDELGDLLWWGPISSGKKNCPHNTCQTPSGFFRIVQKQDLDCVSTTFPQREEGDNGGAEMPFCMYFFRGYALHGSPIVPGYPASHGCLRLFIKDAQWLNEQFVDASEDTFENNNGTRVIIN